MVQRHRRRKALSDLERERFAREATEAHRRLLPYTTALSPLCDDYRAVAQLERAIIEAIRAVTGEDPEWMKAGPGHYPG